MALCRNAKDAASRETVELHNVLIGNVWLCGGQSNMGLPLRFTQNGEGEAKTANDSDIRFFIVEGSPAYRHTDVNAGSWQTLMPESANRIFAVDYYFARQPDFRVG